MEQLLTRIKNILFNPKQEWQIIEKEPATPGGLLIDYAAVLLGIATIAAVAGMAIFGASLNGTRVRYSIGQLLATGLLEFLFTLIGIIISSAIINTLAPVFNSQKNMVQALKAVVYSFTPGWVLGVLALIPKLSFLIFLANLYGIYLLFLGLGFLMKTPRQNSPWYTAASMAVILVVFGIFRIIMGGIFGSPLAGN